MPTQPTTGLGPGATFAVWFTALVIFLAIDMVWLGFAAKDFYRQHLGHLLADDVNWAAAALFYVVFIAGLVFFVVGPALDARSASRALVHGALFGFIAYATYDLTNHATMRDWPPLVTVVDLAWGAVLTSVVSYLTYQVSTRVL